MTICSMITFLEKSLWVCTVLLLHACNISDTEYENETPKTKTVISTDNHNLKHSLIEYDSIRIGKQIWMKKNLKVKTFQNGDSLDQAKTKKEWKEANIRGKPAWCYYSKGKRTLNKDSLITLIQAIKEKNTLKQETAGVRVIDTITEKKINDVIESRYKSIADCGVLYNWYAVNDSRGLAPSGWRIPSNSDFKEMLNHYGNRSSKEFVLNFTSSLWKKSSHSGFEACPCGRRDNKGIFNGIFRSSHFWTVTESDSTNSYCFTVYPLTGGGLAGRGYSNNAYLDYRSKSYGFSVRCIKNAEQ